MTYYYDVHKWLGGLFDGFAHCPFRMIIRAFENRLFLHVSVFLMMYYDDVLWWRTTMMYTSDWADCLTVLPTVHLEWLLGHTKTDFFYTFPFFWWWWWWWWCTMMTYYCDVHKWLGGLLDGFSHCPFRMIIRPYEYRLFYTFPFFWWCTMMMYYDDVLLWCTKVIGRIFWRFFPLSI